LVAVTKVGDMDISFALHRIRYLFELLSSERSHYTEHKIGCIGTSEYHETLSFVPRLPGWFFSDLFTGDTCPLRIPFDKLRAAVSPIPKSRKERRPPASLSRNDFMVSPVSRIPQGVALSAYSYGKERTSISLGKGKFWS
jgi:hypothetical protein